MASILRFVPHVFGDQRPDSFDLVRMVACAAVAEAARANGVPRADAGDVYQHMRSRRFTQPATYAHADDAARAVCIPDPG